MLHSLVVGLGRAGAGLHLRVLAQARRLDRDPFHPGAIVGIDLILWLAFVALTAVLGLTGGWQYYYYSSGSSYYYSYGGSNTLYRVAVAFGTLEV